MECFLCEWKASFLPVDEHLGKEISTTNKNISNKMLSILRKARLKDKEMRILMLYEAISLTALPY